MKKKRHILQRILATFLALLIMVPPAKAIELATVSGALTPGATGPVWEHLANEIYEGDTGVDATREKEELSRLLFADYLEYLDAVGLELAAVENSIQGQADASLLNGECAAATLEAEQRLFMDSIAADADTFASVYCNSFCRTKTEFEFSLIANFAQPEGGIQTCEEKARQLHREYNCAADSPVPGAGSPLDIKKADLMDQIAERLSGSDADLTFERLPDSGSGAGDFTGSPTGPARHVQDLNLSTIESRPESAIVSLTGDSSSDFVSAVTQKKAECQRQQENALVTTIAQPGSEPTGPVITPKRDPFDPRWTTFVPDSQQEITSATVPAGLDKGKNPKCGATIPITPSDFEKLRSAYMRISLEKIYSVLGHWPIFDENDALKSDYLRLILNTSDQLFFRLLEDIESQNKKACYSGETDERRSEVKPTLSVSFSVPGEGEPEDKPGEEPAENNGDEEDPVTVATYFSASSSLTDAFIEGALGPFGSSGTGAATPGEIRAAEIAAGVSAGTISPDNIGAEAASGPYGRDAAAIEAKTREYLAQGEYANLKALAAQIAGGVLSGGAVLGGQKLLSKALGNGQLSALLKATREIIMRPLAPGAQSGILNLNFSLSLRKTLLSASVPYKGSTKLGHALSKHAGRNPEIWGKLSGAMTSWHAQGMKHFRDIVRAPGSFERVSYDGLTFWEKRLADGRGMRVNLDFTFKGFLD
ncbi:MAG TPA: hypothetical protein VE954_30140 [Oligoflexus sp.]|uniref:hypothetical protein n=1 Tax=Oligoflexus sp. TaxID=1971216 RepID=UPI002D658D07|nr:hypothetical protein [Oligoflexus sp.]HYX37385.1 hypothetical protein [Oligoflexus sp.]